VKVTVAKWGNSIAVRLPKGVGEELGLKIGKQLDLTVERGEIRLRSSNGKSSKRLLAEMVKEAKRLGPDFEPGSVDWGPDRGSEIIADDEPA
jgi:antitoxin MazE